MTTAASHPSAPPLLEGVRVLDFGRYIAGPYCAALLGDLGADVIRIERVEGGEDRRVPPVLESGEGGMFLQLNRNKRCLTLDLASEEGRAIVEQLVATADVVVANLPPETLRGLGLDYPTLSARNPRIVLVSVTAFGTEGPSARQAGFDSVGQAMSGAMFLSGLPDAPARTAATWVDFGTAQACAMGALAALWTRERTGRGQCVEGSLLQTALVHTNGALIEQALLAKNRVPQGNRGYLAGPSDVFRARDGWLIVQTIGQAMFGRWCELVGQQAMKSDPRFASDELRAQNGEAISAVMRDWCAARGRDEVLAALAGCKIPAAPVNDLQQALEDEQIQANGMLQRQRFGAQAYPVARHPVVMSATPVDFSRAAPALGEHTDEILAELGYAAEQVASLRERKRV
ncbi:CoA transferase [Variovorax sp. dw_954]|uniref:CaiB/BaiF CoA transferase family protein n=1 Tax=Variovorax sp. dw_954 TaxID=2720078 RepID=UPI001BD3F8DE|nr:CoA transferase [Variovorax sp. dw_954]